MTTEHQSFFEWEDENPLLKLIPLNISFSSMGLLLAHDPKVLWEGENIEESRLPRLIGRIRRVFIVTKIAVEFALQFFEALSEVGTRMTSGVAVWAHVGGFLLGVFVTLIMRKTDRS